MGVFWRSWWLGDVAGGLVVIPLALAWSRPPRLAWRDRGAWQGALVIVAVVGLSVIAVSAEQPVTYLVFPALICAALGLGPQGATLAVAVAAVIAVWAASNEYGPFIEHSPTESALNLQLFITVAALTTLCLAAIVSERQRVARQLAASRARTPRRARTSAGGWRASCTTARRTASSPCRSGSASRRSARRMPRSIWPPRSRELIEEAGAVGADLRRIAHGLSPPLLASHGLTTALNAEARHSAIPVSIVSNDIGLSEPHIERAVYLCCLELIQNAAKHAGPAASVTIQLRRDGNELAFSVHDTGRGFDHLTMARGVGLTGIQDRIDTIGGRIEINSDLGHGTTATGVVPWPARAS